jgi:hypothetical protein
MMKEFAETVLPPALLLAYIFGMVFNLFYGAKGDMTEYILGLILIMLYAKG